MPTTSAIGLRASIATGAKLRTTSYFRLVCTAALVVSVDDDSISTEPSFGARATYSAPIAPPAPGRFSTMTVVDRRAPSFSASTRANTSLLPPGGNGTTIVIVAGTAGAACDAANPGRAQRHGQGQGGQ